MKNERNYNLDLLRIVCMIMVVSIHTLGWGGLIENALVPGTYNWYLGNMLFTLSLPAVNCFVLISGYFLCTSKFKLSKLASIWIQILFYSVGIALLVMCFHEGTPFSFKELIKCAMPFTMKRYWFMTDYLLLYMTFPILNCAIKSMNQKTHLFFCIVLFTIFSLLPNLMYVIDFSSINGGYSFTWFCILYLFASYIKLYTPIKIHHQKLMFPIYVITSLLICGERFLAYYITPYIFGSVKLTSFFYSNNSIVSVLCALALFQAFRGLNIQSKFVYKFITFTAPLTLSVYLIHEQVMLRSILWDFLNPAQTAEKPIMIIYVIVCIISIFSICCLIEWIRHWIFKALHIDILIKKICDAIQSTIHNKFLST